MSYRYCGLCNSWVYPPPDSEEPIKAYYDRCEKEGFEGQSVKLNQLPEKVQLRIKQKQANMEGDTPICSKCLSKTLNEIWLSEAICKECNIELVDIGWSLEQPRGHSVMSTRLMGCPKCRLVYYIPWRLSLEST